MKRTDGFYPQTARLNPSKYAKLCLAWQLFCENTVNPGNCVVLVMYAVHSVDKSYYQVQPANNTILLSTKIIKIGWWVSKI